MKGDVVALGCYEGRKAAAWIKDGQLHDLIVDPPAHVPRRGAIMVGRVDRPAKGIGGQFVDLPHGKGFLKGGQVETGGFVVVQVSGYAEPGKAIPLTDRIELHGRYVVLTPSAPGVNVSRRIRDPARRATLTTAVAGAVVDVQGAVVRSAAETASIEAIRAECAALSAAACRATNMARTTAEDVICGPDAHELSAIEWPDCVSASFDDFEVADMIAAMRRPDVALRDGQIFVEPTRALVAIDVNTRASLSPASALKANLAAARDLPRQLRCRGLGGQIVVDLAPVRRSDRAKIEASFRTAFYSDLAKTEVLGWTPLGLLELRRKRVRHPI